MWERTAAAMAASSASGPQCVPGVLGLTAFINAARSFEFEHASPRVRLAFASAAHSTVKVSPNRGDPILLPDRH
jgi:hypothetical protein